VKPLSKPLSLALIVAAVVCLLVWTTSHWYKNNIYNQDVFSKTVVETIQSGPVSDSIAKTVVDEALKNHPILDNLVGDFAQSTISGLVQSSQFKVVLDETADAFHEVVISKEPEDIALDITPIVNISSVLLGVASITDAELPQEVTQNLEEVSKLDTRLVLVEAEEIPSLYGVTYTLSWLGPLMGLLSFILFAFVLWASSDRVQAIMHIGLITLGGVLIYLLAVPYFQQITVVSASSELTRSIIDVIYTLFSNELVYILRIEGIIALVVILIGFILRKTKYPLDSKSTEK